MARTLRGVRKMAFRSQDGETPEGGSTYEFGRSKTGCEVRCVWVRNGGWYLIEQYVYGSTERWILD